MTPGASVSFFRPEFNDFLYAAVGADTGEMPLSKLPPDTATRRLASLLARLPGGLWPQADLWAMADRLIELLPQRGSSNDAGTETNRSFPAMTQSTLAKMLLCAALGATVLLIAVTREPSSRIDHDVPVSNAGAPPQTAPNSR